jgi:enoyl-CoA hydratase/carnithine racemase
MNRSDVPGAGRDPGAATTTVRVEHDGPVRVVVLDRPERLNAITPELVADLCAALRACHADPEARVIVLTGAGRAFCAGDDLTDVERQAASAEGLVDYVDELQEVTRLLVLGPLPVIGAVRGWAVGGGLEWVADCDLVVMGEGTRCFFPEMSLGVFVTGGVTVLLPRLVGLARARALLLLGERFTAPQALDWGLVNAVVPDDRVLAEALALARRVADLPSGPVADLRRTLSLVSAAELEQALTLEAEATVRGFLDPATAARAAAALADRRRGD